MRSEIRYHPWRGCGLVTTSTPETCSEQVTRFDEHSKKSKTSGNSQSAIKCIYPNGTLFMLGLPVQLLKEGKTLPNKVYVHNAALYEKFTYA